MALSGNMTSDNLVMVSTRLCSAVEVAKYTSAFVTRSIAFCSENALMLL